MKRLSTTAAVCGVSLFGFTAVAGAAGAGAVAGLAALIPTSASAATLPPPLCEAGPVTGPQCYGYKYVCLPPFYPKQVAYYFNSDASEDAYEAITINGFYHPWRCYGD